MTKRFVVGTDTLTAEQVKVFKDSLTADAAWWYWLPNFWLVKNRSETLTAAAIRDAVKRAAPNARCFVMEVNNGSWAALSRKDAKGRNMTDWIKETWTQD